MATLRLVTKVKYVPADKFTYISMFKIRLTSSRWEYRSGHQPKHLFLNYYVHTFFSCWELWGGNNNSDQHLLRRNVFLHVTPRMSWRHESICTPYMSMSCRFWVVFRHCCRCCLALLHDGRFSLLTAAVSGVCQPTNHRRRWVFGKGHKLKQCFRQ